MEFPFHDETLCNLKYWNGDNHNLTDDRARRTEIQQFEIKFFSDTHWYRTYLIWLFHDHRTAVKIAVRSGLRISSSTTRTTRSTCFIRGSVRPTHVSARFGKAHWRI